MVFVKKKKKNDHNVAKYEKMVMIPVYLNGRCCSSVGVGIVSY